MHFGFYHWDYESSSNATNQLKKAQAFQYYSWNIFCLCVINF